MAVSGLPDAPDVDDMTDVLRRAKVGPDMVNTARFGDLTALQALVPQAVDVARRHLEGTPRRIRRQGQRPDRGVP